MIAPSAPAGFVDAARRDLRADVAEVARWRSDDFELSLRARRLVGDDERPPHVRVTVWPAPTYWSGVTSPTELRQRAWALLTAARWLEHAAGPVEVPDDPQITIYDHLQEAAQ